MNNDPEQSVDSNPLNNEPQFTAEELLAKHPEVLAEYRTAIESYSDKFRAVIADTSARLRDAKRSGEFTQLKLDRLRVEAEQELEQFKEAELAEFSNFTASRTKGFAEPSFPKDATVDRWTGAVAGEFAKLAADTSLAEVTQTILDEAGIDDTFALTVADAALLQAAREGDSTTVGVAVSMPSFLRSRFFRKSVVDAARRLLVRHQNPEQAKALDNAARAKVAVAASFDVARMVAGFKAPTFRPSTDVVDAPTPRRSRRNRNKAA